MPYGSVLADVITSSNGVNSAGLYGFKNRIINGAMVIDQRNAGASVTPTASGYTLDRWYFGTTQASKLSLIQSTTAPTGFGNSLLATSLSSYSIAVGDTFTIQQRLEGFNTVDLAWGTASAATVTLSFWVRSSLTGTFGGSISNAAFTRSYPFTYTISAANTFELKTITIAGDTSGTWVGATNAGWGTVNFGLGVGATYSGTAGTWAAAGYTSATGATSVVGTNGATFYITGVQLEKGSTATSFDYRPYGTELQLCQRYYRFANCANRDNGAAANTKVYSNSVNFQNMRAAPSVSFTAVTSTNVSSRSAGNITEYGFTYNTVASASGSMADESIATCTIEL